MSAVGHDAVNAVLDGGTCWGAELDTAYRVLGVTFDPRPGGHPDGPVDDTRLLLVLHPCAEIEARLVRRDTTPPAVEAFAVEQLPTVIDRLGGAPITGPVVDPGHGPLGPPLSLEGRSETADGRRREVVLVLAGGVRELTLRVTCDEVEVRRPDGSVLAAAV